MVGGTWESPKLTNTHNNQIILVFAYADARYSESVPNHETTDCMIFLFLRDKWVSKMYEISSSRLKICDVASLVNTKVCGDARSESKWKKKSMMKHYTNISNNVYVEGVDNSA